jgi:hypothetical protein
VTVDKIKLSGVLERFGDVKVLGDFCINGGILFISFVHHGMQVSTESLLANNVTSSHVLI